VTIKAAVRKHLTRASKNGISSESNKVIFAQKADVYGYGLAQVYILIDCDNYNDLAQAMMKANANEAVKAFGGALQAGIH
jgi:hypothetical protein